MAGKNVVNCQTQVWPLALTRKKLLEENLYLFTYIDIHSNLNIDQYLASRQQLEPPEQTSRKSKDVVSHH